jgi:predicted metal-dependent enzyme (double-stranded beta helix superfamily)
MSYADLPAPLQRFVTEMNELLAGQRDEDDLLPKVGESMRRLVDRDDWLEPAVAQPHPEHYRQYLLYADPEDRFSVVSFVWGPGQETPIHDHTVWGVIGMLRGGEVTQSYRIAADGRPEPIGGQIALTPGAVEFVSPRIGDVHKVRNALDDRVSISIHAYGANIGKVERHVFPPGGGPPREFVSGYSNVER